MNIRFLNISSIVTNSVLVPIFFFVPAITPDTYVLKPRILYICPKHHFCFFLIYSRLTVTIMILRYGQPRFLKSLNPAKPARAALNNPTLLINLLITFKTSVSPLTPTPIRFLSARVVDRD